MLAKDYLMAHHDDTDKFIYLGRKIGEELERGMMPIEMIKAMNTNHSIFEDKNVFYSLNSFNIPRRRSEYVRHLRALYVDLDCYNIGKTPVEVFEILENDHFGITIPEPNVITFTGRGLNCIWWIYHAPKQAMQTWQRVNRYLYEQLVPLGADSSCAEDASRIFRVPGSINSKNGQCVDVSIRHDNKYYLGFLHDLYTPWEEFKPKPTAKQRKAGKKAGKASRFTLMTLNRARMQDLITLQDMRNRAGISEGYRATAAMLYYYYSLCTEGDVASAYRMVCEYNENFIAPLNESEIKSMATYVKTKSLDWLNAYSNLQLKTQAPKSKTDRKGLQISNKRLIELLGVTYKGHQQAMTEEEQQAMLTIIGEEEKKRRERIRQEHNRRKNGQLKRSEYIKREHDKTDDNLFKLKALLEANPKAKRKELAEQLGVSGPRITQLKKLI